MIGTISVDGGQYDAPEELVQTPNSSTELSVVVTDVSA